MTSPVSLAVDIGGTFVDVIAFHPAEGLVRMFKAPTQPHDPVAGVREAIGGLLTDLSPVEDLVHGTTLGLNAVLQRSGAPVGIITNQGFSDLLEIARADVPPRHMYDFQYCPPAPLVSRRHRLGVGGRMDVHGQQVEPLDEPGVVEAARQLVEEAGIRSIAICFLHSYANPSHETRAANLIRQAFPEVSVSVSTELSREYREYERTSTAALDAYIRPVLRDYLGNLEESLQAKGFAGSLHVMRSGGGAMTVDVARRAPLLTVLSGPVGGIVGASELAKRNGWPQVVSFDAGGTSLDTCVILDGAPTAVYEARIDDLPVQIPVFDIRTIGAGGGSIAWIDHGLLKVGPRSAGAEPGPVCYRRGGEEPTITDAALVLGYINPEAFLGGRMKLDQAAAVKAIREKISIPLALDLTTAAARMFQVLTARTVGALREITVERGLDPRGFHMMAFGGAGPMLGPLAGLELEVGATVVPVYPAAFSALGMLMADLEYDAGETVLAPLEDETLQNLVPVADRLRADGDRILSQQGVASQNRRLTVNLDLRYRGQEHSLAVEWNGQSAAELAEEFGRAHWDRYGHRLEDEGEIVTLRVRAVGYVRRPPIQKTLTRQEATGPVGSRPAYDLALGEMVEHSLYQRAMLPAGFECCGPAIVEEESSVTVVPAAHLLKVDDMGQLIITRKEVV